MRYSMRRFIFLPLLFLLSLMGCTKETSIVTSDARKLIADMRYYPTFPSTIWRYRIDTTGATGGTVINAAQRISRITGTTVFDNKEYTVQVNENINGADVTYDTIYVRKATDGLYVTSPVLRTLGRLPGFPGMNIQIPSEFKLFPYPLETASTWQLLNIEFNQIPFFPIYVRVNGDYLGRETVPTTMMTFKDLARVRLRIDARLPNPQDPTNFLNPLVIKEEATFAFGRPLGLLVGDGSQILFTILTGQIPLEQSQKRVHTEVTSYEVVQPNEPCGTRNKSY